MNDLLERYLGAVCSYFYGNKKKKVYNDLKKQLQSLASQYDDLEKLLIKFGHPKSVALSYGYRSFLNHSFNREIVSKVEKRLFIISGIYLFFSTLYYLHQFNCLPFFSTHEVVSTLDQSGFITWTLSHPFLIMIIIFVCSFISLIIEDKRNPATQQEELTWTIKQLNRLPHQSHYPDHLINTYLFIGFIIYFSIYGFVFSSPLITIVQNSSYQMIHLMTYFFQPFILMVIVDYGIDMSKKIYTKKYLYYSSIINLFIFISLTIFIINSSFLKNYLLPFDFDGYYILINVLILLALVFIYFIVLYKLIRNFKSYTSLFKK